MKNYKLKNLKTLSPVFLFRTLFFKDRSSSESYGSQDSTTNKLRLLDNNWSGSLFLSSTSTSKNYRRITLSAFLLFASVTMFGQIAQRGSATTSTSTNASITINKPTGVVAGDIMIANIANYFNSTTQTTASSSGWTAIAGTNVDRGRASLLYKIAGASEPSSYTFTVTSSSTYAAGGIVAFSGVNTTAPFDVTPSSSWTTSSTSNLTTVPTATSLTTNTAVLLFGAASRVTSTSSSNFNSSNWTMTSPSSLTELFDVGNNASSSSCVGAAWAAKPATGATGAGRVNCTVNTTPRLMGGIALVLEPACETVSSASSTPSVCVNSALTAITHTTTKATGIGTATGLPNGVTAEWDSNTITISGTPSETGTFNYSIPLTGGVCGVVNATGTIVVNELPVVTASASTTTFCGSGSVDLTGSSNIPATNVIATVGFENTSNYTATGGSTKTGSSSSTSRPASTAYANTGATAYWINNGTATITTNNFTGLASGVTKTVSMELASFSNGSSTNGADSSDYVRVEISLDGGTTYSREIEVNGGSSGNSYWGFTSGTGVASVTYDGNNSASVFAPTAGGARTTDGYSLLQITLPTTATQVTIRVTMLNNSSSEAWVIDDIIVSQPIVPTYSWTSNPSGFSSSLQNPTDVSVSASTIYTLTTTNPATGCSGSDEVAITVNSNNTVSAGSSTPTLCVNTALTNITHDTTGATGNGTATGLPTGVTAAWANNIITISGTPTESGTFDYSIPLTGGCGTVYATGTIVVNPSVPASVSIVASTTTICSGDSVTFTATPTNGGTTPSYQWTVNGNNVGTNSATFTSTTLTNDSHIKVIMTSSLSSCLTGSPATSNTVEVYYNTNLPASVSIAASATTICSGTSVTFTATPTNGGTTPSYQWKLNGSNVGTDSSTYTSTTLANNDVVSVVMTSSLTSCLSGSTPTSNTVTMTVNDPIGITAITPGVNHISASATTTITASGVVGSNAVVSWYTGSGQVGFLGTGLTSPAVSYGTYYAVVTGTCGSSVELSTTIRRLNIWTGAVSTLWHVHGNWSEGIDPDANTDVIIETGKTVEINRTGLNNAYAHSIDISGTSTLTVKSGNNLTLTDGFSTPAASSFVVESNANLIQLSTAANTTPITVKRETSTLKRLDYILWSSPVVGQNMLAFSPLTTLSPTIRFYSYNTSLNYYNSVPSPSTTNFTTGIGNLIRLPYNHPTAPVVWSGTFAGVPNNGTITVPVTSDPTDATKRYNLIGNPYPSPISIESFIDGNTDNIIAPLYFWRKTNGSTNKSYWAISKVGYTSSGEGSNPNGIIQVGQGFLVQAKANATQVVFNNSMRVLNNNNHFFKTTANNLTNNASRVWLKMTNATGDYSQALVGYFDNATLGIDDEIDAKDINDGVIGINSVINNVDYTIQGRPTFNTNDVVPLSYKVTTAGSYTISIDQVDGLFTGGAQNIFLRDNVLGTCNNLSSSAYTFTSNPGSFQSRFELLYQNSLLSNNTAPAFNANEVVIYHQKSDLVINTGVATMSSIKIFNIKGALLFDKKEINASETRVDIGSTNEVLLVEIVTTEGVKVVKKVYSELVIGSDDDE